MKQSPLNTHRIQRVNNMFQNAEEFLDGVFSLFYQKMHVLEKENYDADRFSFDNVDRSRVINIQEHRSILSSLSGNMPLFLRLTRALSTRNQKVFS